MSSPTPEALAALVDIVKTHAQKCMACKVRLATRSYVDPGEGFRVWVCDAPKCGEVWRCDGCRATGMLASYCPLCGHTEITLAPVQIADAPNAAGMRFANAWRKPRG